MRQVRELASWGCGTTMHVARLIAPKLEREDHTKDIDFTPAAVQVAERGRAPNAEGDCNAGDGPLPSAQDREREGAEGGKQ